MLPGDLIDRLKAVLERVGWELAEKLDEERDLVEDARSLHEELEERT